MTKPNILFLIIDSLRADKFHGERKTSVTPNIDSLIKNGTYFQQAVSSSASTILALSTILTGLYPFKTGLGGETYHKLNSTVTSYVKILRDHGYNAYATAPEVASDFGLVCDFQNPESAYDNYFSLFAGLGDQIIEYFSSNKLKTPWFFYIHLFDLHSPVVVPKEFDDGKFGKSNYEKQVSAIDSWIGSLLKFIDKKNTIIILTADHGEYIPVIQDGDNIINLESSVTEQNLWKIGNKVPKNLYPVKKKLASLLRSTRSKLKSSRIEDMSLTTYQKRVLFDSRMNIGHRMFDDLLRVPLILHGPYMTSNTIISQQVRHVDIFPTICDLLDIKNENEVDGVSLKPLLNSTPMKEVIASIESPPTLEGESTKAIGIRTSKYKYVRELQDNKKMELYDLVSDPLEEYNIAKENSHIIEKMEKQLMNIRQNFVVEESMDTTEIQRIQEKLKKLGYT